MNKQLKKLILEKHRIIRNNQNTKYFLLERLLKKTNNDIKVLQSNEIKRLKSFIWEKERECERNIINIPKEQRRL